MTNSFIMEARSLNEGIRQNGGLWFRLRDGRPSSEYFDLEACRRAYQAEYPERKATPVTKPQWVPKVAETEAPKAEKSTEFFFMKKNGERSQNFSSELECRNHLIIDRVMPEKLWWDSEKQPCAPQAELMEIAFGNFQEPEGANKADLMWEAAMKLLELNHWQPRHECRKAVPEGKAHYLTGDQVVRKKFRLDLSYCQINRINPKWVLLDLSYMTDWEFYCKWGTSPLSVDLPEWQEFQPKDRLKTVTESQIRGLINNRKVICKSDCYGEEASLGVVDFDEQGHLDYVDK